MEKQPAKKHYFFEKGYKDLAALIRGAFSKTLRPMAYEARRVKDLYGSNIFLAVLMTVCDVLNFPVIAAVVIIGSCIFSAIASIGFLIAAFFVYIGFTAVWLADSLFCLFHGIGSHCPTCQSKFRLPAYVCPHCGAVHTALRPSAYGILKRKCACGTKISTTFFNGRQKLHAVCPKCKRELKDGGAHREVMIPVVGGPSSGKTCFVNAAIYELEKNAARHGLEFVYSPNPEVDYEENKRRLSRGKPPVKTSDMRLQYYQFYLTHKGDKMRNLVSLCDVAGEAYDNAEDLSSQIGYGNADAFIMLIDPLSVRQYRSELYNIRGYNASEASLDDILSRLITTLESMHCISSDSKLKTNVVVVFTKSDIPGLEKKIGEDAARKYQQLNSLDSIYEAQNAICEKFLIDYGESNFLNSLKSKFKSVQFFACSALGHVENGKAFISRGVEKPLLWAVDIASAAIDLKNEWGQRL